MSGELAKRLDLAGASPGAVEGVVPGAGPVAQGSRNSDLRGRGDRGEPPVPEFKPCEQRPPELTLREVLEIIPGPRLQELALCFGLWDVDKVPKPDLIRLMQRSPLINVDAVWSQMTVLERGLARRGCRVQAGGRDAAARGNGAATVVKPVPPSVWNYFQMLDAGVLSRQFGGGDKPLMEVLHGTTRRLLSLLLLLPKVRIREVSRSVDVDADDALKAVTEMERCKVTTERVLGHLTEKELRSAAAVWALTAPRAELIAHLSRSIDSEEVERRLRLAPG